MRSRSSCCIPTYRRVKSLTKPVLCASPVLCTRWNSAAISELLLTPLKFLGVSADPLNFYAILSETKKHVLFPKNTKTRFCNPRYLARLERSILRRLYSTNWSKRSETETDSISDSISDSVADSKSEVKEKTAEERKAEYMATFRSKLLQLIEEHEGKWIGQLMHKLLLIYGDMGSFKSYFGSFLALCRHYLYGHTIISIWF